MEKLNKIKIVQPFKEHELQRNEYGVFLAGGMYSLDWIITVDEVLCKHALQCENFPNTVLYVPYNGNITDVDKQISWEYNYLNRYMSNGRFIFTVYFDEYTVQPISMYELGRATRCYPKDNIIVSMHKNAPKAKDIEVQMKLAGIHCAYRTPEEHAKEIIRRIEE